MKNNILITSVGKRVSLVQKFKETLQLVYSDGKIFTTDMCPKLAPAGYVSDKCFKVPRVTSSDYISVLLEICVHNNISLIVPTIDTELLILSENKKLFLENGIYLIVSDSSFIKSCRDKRNTIKLFEQRKIRIPSLRNKYNPVFPMFAKPYDGSLSSDLHVIRTSEDLTSEILSNPKLIFMEYIDKRQYAEYTVDMYYGKDNRVKSIVPRERLEIRAGEINKGYTRKNYLVNYLKDRLDYIPGVIGCICIQLFYKEYDNDVIGIEINPRFGGGYPLSYCAKANYPMLLIKEYIFGNSIDYSDAWLDNTLMLRYDSEIIIHEK